MSVASSRALWLQAQNSRHTVLGIAQQHRTRIIASCSMSGATAGGRCASLVWFRNDLRTADHEPLVAGLQQSSPDGLLLPFYCLDESQLLPLRLPPVSSYSGLGVPQLGPHRLRALLEACAGLCQQLRMLGSDLLFQQGRPEQMVAQLVGLAAAADCGNVGLHMHMQLGTADAEDAVIAAFHQAAAQHGLASSAHLYWGHTLYHPDDLPYSLWAPSNGTGLLTASAGAQRRQQQQQQQQQQGQAGSGATQGSLRINRDQQRFAHLPTVMSTFRKAVQAATPVRPPLPAPASLPPLPAAQLGDGSPLRAGIPTDLHRAYAAAGPASLAALQRWEQLTGVRAADLPAAGSGQWEPRSAFPFTVGEQQGLQRLRRFLGIASSGNESECRDLASLAAAAGPASQAAAATAAAVIGYYDKRMLAGGVENSGKLSAFLALGCISPRTVFTEVARYIQQQQQQQQQQDQGQQAGGPAQEGATSQSAGADAGSSAPTFVWREPSKGDDALCLLMHLGIRDWFLYMALKEGDAMAHPHGFLLSKQQQQAAKGQEEQHAALPAWRSDQQALERWLRGQTGLPFVDASMRELAATGWMSNRSRQNVVSLLAKGLGLDWRLGAEWFACCLLDCDPPINSGNWSYNAGVGHDPRNRIFRTVSQGMQYDPEAQLIKFWCPELAGLPAELAHQPWLASAEQLAAAGVRIGGDADITADHWYPTPIVDPATHVRQPRENAAKLAGKREQ